MERKVREIWKKRKISTMVLVTVFMMLAQSAVAKAEETVEVTVDGILYTLDEENKTAEVTEYKNKQNSAYTEVVIPAYVSRDGEEYAVTTIGGASFDGSSYLKSVTIPNTVTTIKTAAFLGCEKIKEITIPNSVTNMERNVFQQCSGLEKIVLSNSLTQIGYATFVHCESLKEVILPNELTMISEYAFAHCGSLEEIVIPENVTTIGEGAFSFCNGLAQVVIPERVTEATGYSFSGCNGLETIFYPDHLKTGFVDQYQMDAAQVSYIVNDDGTVSLAVEHLPEGMTEISLPSDIGGRKIVSITGPQGVNLPVSCAKHYTKTYTKSADSHQYTCAVCKKPVKEAHSYEKGSQLCVCGYVPFAITAQPTGLQLAYAHKDAVLSVTVKATFGTERITYQWQENGKTISGATAASYAIPSGKPVGSYTYTCKLICGGYSQVTKAAIVTVKPPVKSKKYKDDANMATYKVTKVRMDGKGTVEYVKPVSKKKATVIIPATVEIGGVTYKVTAIAKNAFKNNRNIKRLTIEENVEKIGAKAFYGCKKLKNITIKTTKLKAKKVGANAFKNIKSNATVKVPKKKLKAYKSMLKKKGVGSKAKLRKL